MESETTKGFGAAARALNKFAGLVRRCIDDYDMIEEGETIAVGVSGGKDSLSLLCALAKLREFHPKRFRIHAVTLDMGYGEPDYTPIAKLCEDSDVPFTLLHRDFNEIVFDGKRGNSFCAVCAKMRRGVLHEAITGLGLKKLALAHHFDDAVETFIMSLIYEGRINCFQPVTYMSRAGVTQIRPMLYVKEEAVRILAEKLNLPVVHNSCPMNGVSKREEAKILLKTLSLSYPGIKDKIFGSIQRYPLKGWERK